jgi:hypothetical protein
MTGRRAPTPPTSGPGCPTAPAAPTVTPCPPDPCADPSIDAEDDALISCILDLCATDPNVVCRAASDLQLYSRRPKRIELQEYDGSRWLTTRTVTSGGTTRGTQVWINRGESCDQTKDTVYHEVRHTRQPSTMSSRDRELDAYMTTEQWLIDRGLPGTPAFRTTRRDGTVAPNRAAIERHVDGAYGYSSTTLRIVSRENGGATVVLEDGTRRAAQSGDRYQYIPPQELCERRIPPGRLTCP